MRPMSGFLYKPLGSYWETGRREEKGSPWWRRPTRGIPARSHDSNIGVLLDQHRAPQGSGHVEQQAQRTPRNLIDQMMEGLLDRVSSLRFPGNKLAARWESRRDSTVLFRRMVDQG
jgi:hypothetical protein